MQRCLKSVVLILLTYACAGRASGQVEPLRLYTPAGQAIGAEVCATRPAPSGAELWLIDPATGEVESRCAVPSGRVDLGALFPPIWISRPARVWAVQFAEDGIPRGPALIVEPLTPQRRATDALSASIAAAIEAGDRAALLRLLSDAESSRRTLRQTVRLAPTGPGDGVPNAVRTYLDRRVVLETSAGEIELGLRPDAAPRTCFHFLELAEGGFYDGTVFHRIVAADARGRPFLLQAGDPTGQGAGGPGFAIDFEPSPLAHDFGVVSMARQPTDPNSAGSQFFICLSREACAPLDGQYASFAQVVRGAEVLSTLAASPLGPPGAPGPEGSAGPRDRPLDPPVIRAVRCVPGPPMGFGPPRPEPRSPEAPSLSTDR